MRLAESTVLKDFNEAMIFEKEFTFETSLENFVFVIVVTIENIQVAINFFSTTKT